MMNSDQCPSEPILKVEEIFQEAVRRASLAQSTANGAFLALQCGLLRRPLALMALAPTA